MGVILSVVFVVVCELLAFYIITNLNNKATDDSDSQEKVVETTAHLELTETTVADIGVGEQPESEPTSIQENIIEEKLSQDQKRLLEMFGYPDAFTIMFDEGNENKRIDIWAYKDIEACFIFENGTYLEYSDYFPEESFPGKYSIMPQEFCYPMSASDVKDIIGEEGIKTIDDITGLNLLIFGDGELICVFNPDDVLIIANKSFKKAIQ